jgi:beta-lactamase class D
MLRETVQAGSARSSFAGFFHGAMAQVEVGGKTGSLSGLDPQGRYDWFVGYATAGPKKLAYAALCINRDFWYVKSAFIARKAIEHYFGTVD